jgi:hypothetical protein
MDYLHNLLLPWMENEPANLENEVNNESPNCRRHGSDENSNHKSKKKSTNAMLEIKIYRAPNGDDSNINNETVSGCNGYESCRFFFGAHTPNEKS